MNKDKELELEGIKKIRGRFLFENNISREGESYLSGRIELFDGTFYYLNIFKNSKYLQNNEVYDKAIKLNDKNIVVTYKDVNKYSLNNIVDIEETDEISPKIDIEEYTNSLREHLSNIKNKSYSAAMKRFMRIPDIQSSFFKTPFSDKGGLALEGGLLKHVVDTMDIIDSLGSFVSRHIDIDLEFMKLITLMSESGRVNLFEMKDGVAVKTFEGNFVDTKSMTYKIVNEFLATSRDYGLTQDEIYLILHSCTHDDTMKNSTNVCKTKESLMLTSMKYFGDLVNNLLLLKFNNLNGEDFMQLYGKNLYVKNL